MRPSSCTAATACASGTPWSSFIARSGPSGFTKEPPMFKKWLLRELSSPTAGSDRKPVTKGRAGLGPSAHVDTFTRDNLPPDEQWPDLLLDRPEFNYPDHINVGVELTDRMVEKGFGDHVALIGNGRRRTYKELADWSNRVAHALTENYGVKPGNRVLIRSGNNPALVAAWLAATKAGAVVVNTMPMLRAGELNKIVDKAEISLALCDSRIADELVACAKDSQYLKKVVSFDGTSNHDA